MKALTAYQEGYKAFREGLLGNPYSPNTSRHRDWEFGFNKAYFNNLEWVKKKEAERGSSKKAAHSN